jgi:hypothetical protein
MRQETRLRAAVAALCLWAAVSPAVGSIVYHQPTHLEIWTDYPGTPLDLNMDGVTDFAFAQTFRVQSDLYSNVYEWRAVNGSGFTSDAVSLGTAVGPSLAYVSDTQSLGAITYNYVGKPPHWSGGGALQIPAGDSYRGLRFVGPGNAIYYGWLRFSGNINVAPPPSGYLSIEVVDYAYETSPGVPIQVGAIPAPGEAVTACIVAIAAVFRRKRGDQHSYVRSASLPCGSLKRSRVRQYSSPPIRAMASSLP